MKQLVLLLYLILEYIGVYLCEFIPSPAKQNLKTKFMNFSTLTFLNLILYSYSSRV
jgi:hypothetical protein